MGQLEAWLEEHTPEAWRQHEPLPGALRRVWEGFWALQGDRRVVAGFGGAMWLPLPYTAKRSWLNDHAIRGAVRRRYEHLWEAMDALYLTHMQERQAEQAGDRDGREG